MTNFKAYLGRKCVAKGDDFDEVIQEAREAVQHTGKNPWRDRHSGSVVIWDNFTLIAVGVITDDANGVVFHDFRN